MIELQHTHEPWRTDYRKRNEDSYAQEIFDSNGETIAIMSWYPVVNGNITSTNRKENASRIVACVNACKGIDNDTLEAGAIVKSDKLFIITKEHFAACDMLGKLAKAALEVIEDNDNIGSFDASKLCELIIKAEELLRV